MTSNDDPDAPLKPTFHVKVNNEEKCQMCDKRATIAVGWIQNDYDEPIKEVFRLCPEHFLKMMVKEFRE